MKRRFVICFDGLTQEQGIKIKDFLNENKLGWWKWVGDAWFVIDTKDKFTAATLRTKVKEFVPNQRLIVLEMNDEGDTWAGVRANDPEDKMFRWIHKFWKK